MPSALLGARGWRAGEPRSSSKMGRRDRGAATGTSRGDANPASTSCSTQVWTPLATRSWRMPTL